MPLSDYNPLEYFKELTIFPRTVFLVGFVVFLVGIAHGSVYNKTVFAGLTIIALGLSCHYFSICRWQEPHEPYRMHFDRWIVLRAFLLLLVTIALGTWAYLIPAEKSTDTEKKSQQTATPVQASQTAPESKPITEPKVVSKTTSDAVRGTLNQKGDKNIAQIGNNNQATINPHVDPNKPVITYDFRGTKRTASPGEVAADNSAWDIFAEMMAKKESQDWSGLASLAEQAKVKAPEWLTPYFMAGEAYLNLCQTDKARRNLEHFVEKAKPVSSFEDAVGAAETDLDKLKARSASSTCKESSASGTPGQPARTQDAILGSVQQQGNGNIAQIGVGNNATVINTGAAMPHASWQMLKNSGNSVELRITVDKAYPGAMFAVVCDRPCEPTEGAIDYGQNRPQVVFGPEVRFGHPNNPDSLPDVAAFKVDFPAVLTPEYAMFATVKSADGTPLTIRGVKTLTITGR